jgi:hypothetical protein
VRIADIPLRADLEFGKWPLTALLPSGSTIPLRLKPPERLALPGPWPDVPGKAQQAARNQP